MILVLKLLIGFADEGGINGYDKAIISMQRIAQRGKFVNSF